MSARPATVERALVVAKMAEEGKSYAEMAAAVGVNLSTIAHYLNVASRTLGRPVKRRPAGRPTKGMTNEQRSAEFDARALEAAAEYAKGGETMTSLARRLGCSDHAIRRRLDRADELTGKVTLPPGSDQSRSRHFAALDAATERCPCGLLLPCFHQPFEGLIRRSVETI